MKKRAGARDFYHRRVRAGGLFLLLVSGKRETLLSPVLGGREGGCTTKALFFINFRRGKCRLIN